MTTKYYWTATIQLTDGRSARMNGDATVSGDLGNAERDLQNKLDSEYRSKMGVGVQEIDIDWKLA